MRKGLMLTILMGLSFVLFGFGCSDNQQETTMNVSGSWSAHLSANGQAEVSSTSSPYRLYLNKTGQELSGEIHFPEDDAKPVFILSGTDGPEGISLIGSNGQDTLKLSGQMLDVDALQLMMEKGDGQITHLLFFRDKQPPLTKFDNLNFLEKKCGQGSPVVLIHGMDDDATTWQEMLIFLSTDGICERHSIWVYQYDWKKHIGDNASILVSSMDLLRHDTGEFSGPSIIVAHSMGGLVARSFIAQGGWVSHLITLGTPHQGSPLADLSSIFTWAVCAGVGDLKPGSDFIKDLNANDYEKSQRSNYVLLNGRVDCNWQCTKRVRNHCVWGHWEWTGDYPSQIKAGWAAMDRPNDGMVPESSARFDGDPFVNRHDTFYWYDHIALNKPSKAPEVYKYIRDFLNRH